MRNFRLQRLSAIQGKQSFYTLNDCANCPSKLVCPRSKDSAIQEHKCELGFFDQFEKKCGSDHANLAKQLRTVYSRMQLVAELRTLPKEKYKDITPNKELIKEYEIKTEDLRVYLFHFKEHGKVIVVGGLKGDQQNDINHFRNLKKEFIEYFKKINKQ